MFYDGMAGMTARRRHFACVIRILTAKIEKMPAKL
jgi:hypothetical protein